MYSHAVPNAAGLSAPPTVTDETVYPPVKSFE
jgi:hypothetical protein